MPGGAAVIDSVGAMSPDEWYAHIKATAGTDYLDTHGFSLFTHESRPAQREAEQGGEVER
jgi:hypothetical protein